MKKKILLIPLALLLAMSLVAIGCSAPAPAPAPPPAPVVVPAPAPPEVITLKALRPWPWESTDVTGYREFLSRVNQKAAGRLVLEDVGGSEVYPSREQFKPLQLGIVDLLFTSSGYIADTFPEPVILMHQFGATLTQLREAGVIKRLDEIGRQEHGVIFLGIPWFANAHIWLTKPIKTLDDLRGLKIRSHPAYDPLIKGLGVPTVTVSFGEIYTALDRGVIDGFVFPYFDIITYGLHEVVKYRVDPPFWRAGWVTFLMNAESFDALPNDLQKLLVDTVIELENDAPGIYDALAAEEWVELEAAGLQSIRISDAEWLETQRISWEGIQEILRKVSPAHSQELIQLLAQFYPPKAPYLVID